MVTIIWHHFCVQFLFCGSTAETPQRIWSVWAYTGGVFQDYTINGLFLGKAINNHIGEVSTSGTPTDQLIEAAERFGLFVCKLHTRHCDKRLYAPQNGGIKKYNILQQKNKTPK